MSLINDALKRAKQAHDEKTPPAFQGAPLHTVPPKPSRPANPMLMPLMAGMMFLVLLGIVILFFMSHGSKPATSTATVTPQPVAAPDSVVAPASAPMAKVIPPPQPVVAKPTSVEPVASSPPPASAPASASVITPASAAILQAVPEIKLQGVLYNPTRPAAIINGRSMFVGDHVGDLRVIAIHEQSATVVWNGHTNELTMER